MNRKQWAAAFALAAAAAITPAAQAVNYSWTGLANDGLWQTGASQTNWLDDTAAAVYTPGNGGNNTFTFVATGYNSAVTTINVTNGHNPNVNNLALNGNITAPLKFVVDGTNSNTHIDFVPLTSGAETLTVNSTGNEIASVNAGTVSLQGADLNAWRISGSAVFTVSAQITGSSSTRGIVKYGGGTLRLTGSNSFGGALVARDGTTELNSLANRNVNSAAGTGAGGTGAIQFRSTTTNGGIVYTGGDTATDRPFLLNKDTRDVPAADFTRFITNTGSVTLNGGITATAGGNLDHFVDFSLGGNGNVIVNTAGVFGDISVIKTGTGRVEINADSLWRGTTTVSAGTLLINANHNVIGGGAYAVQAGGTLGGDGTIAGAITIDNGGTLAGGDTLNVSSVTLNGTYAAGLIAGNTFGSVVSGGAFTIGSDASLAMLAATPLTLGQTFTIIDTNDQLTGTFAGLTDGTVFAAGPNNYRINYAAGDVTLTTVVPEPAALAVLSIAGFAVLRRRR